MKRLLDAAANDLPKLKGKDLVNSIRLSEGRTIAAEIIAIAAPLIDKLSNVELAAAFGADILLLNLYEVTKPQVMGMPDKDQPGEPGLKPAVFGKIQTGMGRTLADVRDWTGCLVGLNLEPIENPAAITGSGRLATPANAQLAVEQGADLLVITGNPGTGVTTAGIARSVRMIRAAVGDSVVIFAGKAHAAGSYEPVVSADDLAAFVAGGADGVILPAPGTIPGSTLESCQQLVIEAHRLGALALNGIGTSQEGASVTTIEQIALMSKMSGADIHHIGDSGTFGMAVPENIYAYSMAIRGRRHTWFRMGASLKR